MFSFLSMIGNYEERKVDNYQSGFLTVDTCKVTDSQMPYETAVEHPNYNNGKWVIVETYLTKQQAQEGHTKWVTIMTTEPLPVSLVDVSTADVALLGDIFGEGWREKRGDLD